MNRVFTGVETGRLGSGGGSLPRAYFEHALREMPISTKVVILVHAAPSTLIDKEYLELLRAFIISHGLEVIGTPWKPSHDGLDYQQTDCDLLFMSSSSCLRLQWISLEGPPPRRPSTVYSCRLDRRGTCRLDYISV